MPMLTFRVDQRDADEAQRWAAELGIDRSQLLREALHRHLDPVDDRIGAVVVAALTRTRRGFASELVLTPSDGVPSDSVVNFDNIHTIPRDTFRRRVTTLSPGRTADACRTL